MGRRPKYIERAKHLAELCHGLYSDVPILRPGEYLVRQRNEEKDWCVVDARSEAEQSVSTLPDAIGAEAFEADPEACTEGPILVYCTAGCRSGAYARKLREADRQVYNLWGGILTWALGGRPFVTPDGKPTRSVAVRGLLTRALSPAYSSMGRWML
jgi:rhodanese-related sulfurtransferase